MDLGLSGKVAIVTAGSQGIGKAVAGELAREGANVSICARGLEDLGRAVKAGSTEHKSSRSRPT